ncbi:MAG: hypothetical protein QOF56_3185 [Acidobacteriaceae bacterium]|nr:hypothetical protein [Acidobacteriaceae bacterium]
MARQPILPSNERVFGYELLFRDDVENIAQDIQPDIQPSENRGIDGAAGRGVSIGNLEVPNVARDLLANIGRLEPVAWIFSQQLIRGSPQKPPELP